VKRIRVASKGALIRIGALFLALGIAALLAYGSMFSMPGRSHRGSLPPATPDDVKLRETLRGHVSRLAGEIGERTVLRPKALEAAAAWIEEELRGAGYPVEREEYDVDGVRCRNLIAVLPGREGETLVVGAHYDSPPGSPGADDNATGVAGLVEIARALRAGSPRRTVRFVAFANEEPPHFQTSAMGSVVHARASKARGDRIAGAVVLESIGFYREGRGTQQYPYPFSLLYPDTGDFIGFVGDFSSRSLVKDAIAAFRRTTPFPSEGGAPPGWIPGVGWSDQWSFWQEGYPGIMITDTAPFRNPHYHTPRDRPDTIDFDRLARVVGGLIRAVEELAGGQGSS
jgi:hypothetical protein